MTQRCYSSLPSLSQVVSTAVSSQAGRGSNTFIPPGREHSSAAVFAPLLPPHLISDIVTTVAASVAFSRGDRVTVKPLPCAHIGPPLLSAPQPLLLLLLARQWRRSVRKPGS
ncbi:hypothetical protein NQZ68_030513 [Dissostichus eleginoides]|nr:hypothetical protein NQZ68_030513 [Dissostichus eleginoides]